jgi:cytochrome c-type biogenesis protein CcmH
MRAILAALILAVMALPAFAVSPGEVLADPALEARARSISAELRCLVCQNQSIDDSDADLAHDLRVIVRERLTAGDTDQQVLDYVVARYGEFVLLRPVLAWHTLVLWIAAPAVLVLGIVAVFVFARQGKVSREETGARDLTEEEKSALAKLEQ